MFKNYLKFTFRNIKKHKFYSFVNIFGLAVGMACCIMTLLFIRKELSFDKFHKNRDSIYRVISDIKSDNQLTRQPRVPSPFGPALKEKFPEIVNFTRFMGPLWHFRYEIDNNMFLTHFGAIADHSFFKMFTFPFLAGDPETAFNNPDAVVITEKFAKICFGNENALGKTLRINDKDRQVTGIMQNIPENSHIQFELIIPIQYYINRGERGVNDWNYYSSSTVYIQIPSTVDYKDFNGKIKDFPREFHLQSDVSMSLQPLDKVHLHSNFNMDMHMGMYNVNKSDIKYIYMLSFISASILLIACFNYMNLYSAVSSKRSREIGIKKVFGSKRKDIIIQFQTESFFLVSISLIFAIILAVYFLPVFNQYSSHDLKLTDLFSIQNISGLIFLTVFVGLLSGSYPSYILSSFKPVNILKKSQLFSKRKFLSFKTILVVFQFTIAILIIIVTAVSFKQLNFMNNRDLGFNLDNTIVVVDAVLRENHETFKNEILTNPNIIAVTQSVGPYVYVNPVTDVQWEGKDPNTHVTFYYCKTDYDYIKTFNIEIADGRFFSKEFSSDTTNYVLNETAARQMGISSPVGRQLTFNGVKGTIIGILKDCHFESLRREINPLVYRIDPTRSVFYVKVDNSENFEPTIAYLKNVRKNYSPVRPLYYYFEDEYLAEYTAAEKSLSQIFIYISFLTIFIACLGLLALSIFSVEQKTKEIGIRKVTGANTFDIVRLLSTGFIKCVVLSNLIAWPLAYFAVKKWLQGFAYRINISIDMFLLAGFLSLMIAVLTVFFQTVKAAKANPVDSLKYE
ncbi:ABC transporter permease [candidate division KSB1 bacterium]